MTGRLIKLPIRAFAEWVKHVSLSHSEAIHEEAMRRVRLAAPALVFGLRFSMSVCLALYVAFWLQLDNAYWAGLSASLVAQSGIGASFRKGHYRAIGTFLGGAAIVLVTAIFPQNHAGLLLSITVWAGICGFLAGILPNFAGYAAAVAGYTAVIVFSSVIDNPQNVFLVAVTRMTEVSIGIFAAELVFSLTDLGDARSRLARMLGEIATDVARGLRTTLVAGRDTSVSRTSRRELIRRVVALGSTLDQVVGEPTHLRRQFDRLQAGVEALFTALSAWRSIVNHLSLTLQTHENAFREMLLSAVSLVVDRAWFSDPKGMLELCAAARERTATIPTSDLSSQLLTQSVAEVFHSLERVANALVLVVQPGSEWPDRAVKRLQVPDILPPALNALRAVIALSALQLFWFETAWPEGPTAVTFAAIAILLFSPLMDAAYVSTVDFGIGNVLAAVIAAVLNLAILPMMHGGFIDLALVLVVVLLPLGALSAGSWHKIVFVALASNVVPIIAIENEPRYDGAGLLNAALAITGGTVAALIFIRLLPSISPRGRAQRLLNLTLRDLMQLATRRRQFTRDAWIDRIAQRFAVMPGEASREQVEELLSALSVGEAVIALIEAGSRRSCANALTSLPEAHLTAAGEPPPQSCVLRGADAEDPRSPAPNPAVQAVIIDEALRRHPLFFSR